MAKNYLSIITLNVNRFNASIKRHRVAEWIRNHDPIRNQDGGIGRHTAPPRTTRTDKKSNCREVGHQVGKKETYIQTSRRGGDGQPGWG